MGHTRNRGSRGLVAAEPSAWTVVPVVVGVVALLVLGLHPPVVLADVIGRAAALLGGAG